jgi:hypothetical protein
MLGSKRRGPTSDVRAPVPEIAHLIEGGTSPMAEGSKKAGAARRVVWGRRFLAATVVVPPSMADHLNMDAMAVLAVIRNEAAATGRCTLPVARIAERANIGRAKARAAIRLAESLGAIAIEAAPDRRRVEMLFAHLKRILRLAACDYAGRAAPSSSSHWRRSPRTSAGWPSSSPGRHRWPPPVCCERQVAL